MNCLNEQANKFLNELVTERGKEAAIGLRGKKLFFSSLSQLTNWSAFIWFSCPFSKWFGRFTRVIKFEATLPLPIASFRGGYSSLLSIGNSLKTLSVS